MRFGGRLTRLRTFSVNASLPDPSAKNGSPMATHSMSMSGSAGSPTWSPTRSCTRRRPGATQELPSGAAATSFVPQEEPTALVATTRYEYVTRGSPDWSTYSCAAPPTVARACSSPPGVRRRTRYEVTGDPPSSDCDQVSFVSDPLRVTVSRGAPGTVAPAGSNAENSRLPPVCRTMVPYAV